MSVDFGKLLYGGDYNPEQWLDSPDILEKDVELMKEAQINVVSLGIFSWAALEPQEDVYQFEWMEQCINRLYENGISVFLATPSGSKPKWMADKYPEILRVDENRNRNLYGLRHNHCYTSPVYRKKVRQINQKLAEKFGDHPAVLAWHISNEFSGECHCPLCQHEFQQWLKKKYKTIDVLNKKWATAFWSHTYQSFEQIESPSPRGESLLHALNLDWRRFVTDRTIDFYQWEVESLRLAGSNKPATTNMMYNFDGLNYFKFKNVVDFVSWDSYPTWHKGPEYETALDNGFQHDLMRSIKKAPFILMESCPSSTNWQSVSKLKRPGMLEAASLQAIAHGADSVMYFQIRQSRGASEKFHGAVIDHYGGNDTRVYQEVKQVGEALLQLEEVKGAVANAKVAVVCDTENRWAMQDAAGPRNKNLFYKESVEKSYKAFRKYGLDVDIIDMESSLESYQVLAVPMMYMFRAGFEQKLRSFVAKGGTVFMTYWSGIVDDTDLCFLQGTPHGLEDVFGLRREEIDALYDGEYNEIIPADQDLSGLEKHSYRCEHLCDLVKVDTAKTLMVYNRDFYQGKAALTCNSYEKGKAYYICADMEQAFYNDLYQQVLQERNISPIWKGDKMPEGIEVTSRSSQDAEYVFLQNYTSQTVQISIPKDAKVIFGSETGTISQYKTLVLKF